MSINHTPTRKRRGVCCLVGDRPISTSQLQPLQAVHFWPINPMVYRGPDLNPQKEGLEGELILEQASRLDAFSGYPSRT